ELRAVEELEDGDVDVPQLVGEGGADTDRRLRRMEAGAGTAPATLAEEARPRGGGGEHLAGALGVEAQDTKGHVAVVGRLHHRLHRGNLFPRQLVRRRRWCSRPTTATCPL